VVESDRTDYAPAPTVGGGETSLLERALGEHNLITERGHPDRFDVDAELTRPELRDQRMRATIDVLADHVVRGDLRAQNRIVSVLHG
jgi:hypothetical protein